MYVIGAMAHGSVSKKGHSLCSLCKFFLISSKNVYCIGAMAF